MSEEKTIEFFKDVKKVLAYLNAQGRKASRNSVYRHMREGKLCRNAEGVFEVRAVNLYAKRHLQGLFEPYTDDLACEAKDLHPEGMADEDGTFTDVQVVRAYLLSRGWFAPRQTLYRHIAARKLKRNSKGRFEIISIEKYARKNLKCLDVKNASSDDMARLFQTAIEKFFRDKAGEITSFLSGDTAKAEELKTFLTDESRKYFKLQHAHEQGESDEHK